MLHVNLFVACLCWVRGDSAADPSILTRLPDALQEMCPGANVCRENQTSDAPQVLFEIGYESCCTGCSCSSGCGENGNCCFPFNQQDGLGALQNSSSCLFPSTKQPWKGHHMYYQSYYMVSSFPEKDQIVRTSVSNISCGDEKVAPWGSFYPIYSAKCKQIYVNAACAPGNCLTDGTLWEPIVNCPPGISITSVLSSIVLGPDSNSFPDTCDVSFIYPGNLDDLKPFKCYVSLVNTCPSEFQIPDGIGLSIDDIVTWCTSGLLSPFRNRIMYANVFCLICNTKYFRKDQYRCSKIDDAAGKSFRQSGFTGLIDMKFLKDGLKKTLGEAPDILVACNITNKNICRPVFCASGQLRDRTGKCTYVSKIWYDQTYAVYVNLTSEEAFNVSELFKITPARYYTHDIPVALKSPWPADWTIAQIYHEVINGSEMSTALLVIIWKEISRIKPRNIVQNIKNMVTREWFLERNNTITVLKADFTSFNDITAQPVFGNRTRSFRKPRYRKIYINLKRLILFETHLITRLYLCDQVELNQSDFILSNDKTALFNTLTQRAMFDGQFILVSSNTYVGVRARICIEDSRMYKIDALQNKGAFREVYDLWFVVAAVLCALLNIRFKYLCCF